MNGAITKVVTQLPRHFRLLFLLTSVILLGFLVSGQGQVLAYDSIDISQLFDPICKPDYPLCGFGSACYTGHTGVDVCSVTCSSSGSEVNGPLVYAAGPGIVKQAAFDTGANNGGIGFGNYVAIEHTLKSGEKIYSYYAHLYEMRVKVNDEVSYNTVIGVMGKTGTGSNNIVHLHFELRRQLGVASSYFDPSDVIANKRPSGCLLAETATPTPGGLTPTATLAPTAPTSSPGANANNCGAKTALVTPTGMAPTPGPTDSYPGPTWTTPAPANPNITPSGSGLTPTPIDVTITLTPTTVPVETPEPTVNPPVCVPYVGPTSSPGNGTGVEVPPVTVPPATQFPQRPVADTSDISTYYYDLPDNYHMNSCQKLASGDGTDIIKAKVPIGQCVNGKNSRNTALCCSKDWLVAYSEVLTVDNFPLLNWFSAAEPTKDNNLDPICKKDINNNVTSSANNQATLKFSNEYSGLLYFVDTSANKRQKVNYPYPKLGTATACGAYEHEDVSKNSLYIDVNSLSSDLPTVATPETEKLANLISDTLDLSNKEDFIARMSRWIRYADSLFFTESLKSKVDAQIKDIPTVSGTKETSVCNDLERPVTAVNISDPVTYGKPVVVNDSKEFIDLTNTEVCDNQFRGPGTISGAKCYVAGSHAFIGDSTTPLTCNYPGSEARPIKFNNKGEPTAYSCANTICGKVFECDGTMGQAYEQCRTQGIVNKIEGNPLYELKLTGYDKLAIPGANKMLDSEVQMTESLNSSFEVQYGKNIGIMIPAVHALVDLGSANPMPYNLSGDNAKDLRKDDFRSMVSQYISYRKQPHNAIFGNLNDFSTLAAVKLQYYFPFLGKVPTIQERFTVINSNAKNIETAYTLTRKYKDSSIVVPSVGAENPTTTGTPAVAGWFWSSKINPNVIDPQIVFCEDLTEAQQLEQDCFCSKTYLASSTAKKCNDPIKNYLCKEAKLGLNCVEPTPCLTPTPLPTPSPTPTPRPGPTDDYEIQGEAPFSCQVMRSESDVSTFVKNLQNKYSASKIKDKTSGIPTFAFTGSYGDGCNATFSPVVCGSGTLGLSWMTNKLILHESMHRSRNGVIDGQYVTQEFQASLMEDVVVSGCSGLGGEYTFIGKDGNRRTPGAISNGLLTHGASEEDLWNFALGNSDTISPFVGKFISGATKYSDIYCKGYYLNQTFHASTLSCSSGSPTPTEPGSNPTTTPVTPTSGPDITVTPTPTGGTTGYCSDTTPIDSGNITPTPIDIGNGTPSITIPGDTTAPGQYTGNNIDCLFKIASKSVNSKGLKITPEVVWAIAKHESASSGYPYFICPLTWEGWANHKYTTDQLQCKNGANSLAFTTFNGYNPSTIDVRGLTQFWDKTFVGLVNSHKQEMQDCINALGTKNPPAPEAVDPLTTSQTGGNFTRYYIGDMICATTLKLAYDAKSYNGSFIKPDQWKDINGFGGTVFRYVAGKYQGNCSLGYCDTTIALAKKAVTSKMFDNLSCGE